MARTTIRVPYTGSFSQVQQTVEGILKSNGFSEKQLASGEQVWKKGTGFMTAMQFVKVDYGQGEIFLHGWVQAGLGDVGGGEMDLTGFVAIIPKQSLMKVLEKISQSI